MTPRFFSFFLCSFLAASAAFAAPEPDSDLMSEVRRHFVGEGTPVDHAKAVQLARIAADQGEPEAMQTLGFCYLKGIGLEADESEAARWYKQAALAGSPRGQLNYGLMLLRGRGIEKDSKAGLEWMEKAASQDFPEGQYVLGELYFLADDDLKTERNKAFPLLLPLAKNGHPKAQNLVGLCFRDQIGTEANHQEAILWFRRAAQQGEPKAQSNLGHLLGVDSPKSPNREEALMWILISMGQGEITAKKTYDELLPSFPPLLLTQATARANQFQPTKENSATTKPSPE